MNNQGEVEHDESNYTSYDEQVETTDVENKTSIEDKNEEGDSSDGPLKQTKFPATILDGPIVKNDGTSLGTKIEAERWLDPGDNLHKGTKNSKLVPEGWKIKEGEIN